MPNFPNPINKIEDFIEVNTDRTSADFSNLQDALDYIKNSQQSMPILLVGEHTVTSPAVFPDKDVQLYFAPGSRIIVSGNISLFKVPDGLTGLHLYQILGSPVIQGNHSSSQTLVQIDDTSNYGNVVFRNAHIKDIKWVDWSQYDLNYDRQSVVTFDNCHINTLAGAGKWITTPNPAGTYGSPVAVKIFNCAINQDDFDNADYATIDADVDLWIENSNYPWITAGSAWNGLMMKGTFMIFDGSSGDLTINGNSWDIYDYAVEQSGFSAGDMRIVWSSGHVKVDIYYAKTCFKFTGLVDFRCSQMDDRAGFSNPGVEIAATNAQFKGSVIHGTRFCKNAVAGLNCFPQGCIVLTSQLYTKVYANNFTTDVTGKVLIETAGSNKNVITGNTGYASGTGVTIVGANTVQANNVN
jgi:hypothetical protein